MRAAHGMACGALGAVLDPRPSGAPPEAWGWRGRTLGRPVGGPYGPAWLRVVHSPVNKADGKLWTGPEDAERLVPRQVPRPRLRRVRQWTQGEDAFKAELYDRVVGTTVAPGAVLAVAPSLPAAWWDRLRVTLDLLSAVRTERTVVRQAYLDRAMPRYLAFLDGPVPTTPPRWSTAHGDLHWANLAGPDLSLLDWEGWGAAPAGYDAALLHAYSLAVPETARRVRRELATVLDTDAGRFAELAVITELLQSAGRGDNLALVHPLRRRAAEVWPRTTTGV
ncbi:hypothetical protein [Streptomyces sp. SID10815]|uniref:hypothetical protein n=1 Tax=Streptomyces sp. SID10815 TaxID=2706027 RepID=UPI0013C63AAD|nr:hypothetical protein [Streptomyces sp. SID10815]NEA47835.1 hypothetical protein [Streptomyces sp. SID10815]